MIKLSSLLVSDVTSGTHVSMDDLSSIDFGFWPPKPILAARPPDPIINVAIQKNIKRRVIKPFPDLNERQKRNRLAEYRLLMNAGMSLSNLSDIDQSDMLQYYSDENRNRRTVALHQWILK